MLKREKSAFGRIKPAIFFLVISLQLDRTCTNHLSGTCLNQTVLQLDPGSLAGVGAPWSFIKPTDKRSAPRTLSGLHNCGNAFLFIHKRSSAHSGRPAQF
jgi:hypothetical protein